MTKINSILRNEKVLVVDDFQEWLNVARNNLVYYGCPLERIVTAKNIEEGFRKYKNENPTLNFIDINFNPDNLKDTQGFGLIRRLRGDNYTHPIIAMSSLTENIRERVLDAGANFFIGKMNFVEDFDRFIEWYSQR